MYKPELKHRGIVAIGILCFCLLLPLPQKAEAATEQYIGSFGGMWGTQWRVRYTQTWRAKMFFVTIHGLAE